MPNKTLRHWIQSFAVAAGLLTIAASAQAPLDVRVALVIGNAAYAGSAALANPANDARAMADTLKQLGFTVVELRDSGKTQMTEAIVKVREALKGKQGVGMLYYAGHGLQLDWRNYMVPVDAKMASAADVPNQSIDVNTVLDAFKGAGNRMNILVLDACRDNPFAASASGKGLAQVDAPPGTFLAYATAPGNVAEDGDVKGGNGLYTQYLLEELKKPTARIEDVFKRVRLNVRKQSQGRQIPWESTSLEDDFYFNRGVALAKPDEAAKLVAFNAQKADWAAIRDSTKPDDYFAFLQKHPQGELAEEAQFKLDRLVKPKIVAALGKDQDANLAFSGERFQVGDEYGVQVKDILTGVPIRSFTSRVTAVKGDVAEINNGAVLFTILGGWIKTSYGQYNPPWGGGPAEYQVGKSWEPRSTETIPGGQTNQLRGKSKIVGRETISVPAGKFSTYVIEFTGYSSNGSVYQKKAWVDPRFGYPIKSELIGRRAGGTMFQSEVSELVSLKAARS